MSIRWLREADVVVVGSGFSGLAAAIEAHDAGASVVVLDKRRTVGGNSVIAGGMYNAVNQQKQKALGIEDSTEFHFEQTLAGGDFRADPVKVRYMVDHAHEGWLWLEGMGVELFTLCQAYGALWPRSHVPKYKEKRAGAAIVAALRDQVRARHIPVLLEHKVNGIYRPQSRGRVLGVELEAKDGTFNLQVKKGLVLASGGFCADVEMRMRHDPRFDARFGTTCHRDSTGETLNQAQDIGADVVGLDFIQSIGPSGPDARYVRPPVGTVSLFNNLMRRIGGVTVQYCIYTDLRGRRIVASDARRDQITEAVMRTPEKVCVGISDDVGRKKAAHGETSLQKLRRLMQIHPEQLFVGQTIRELAQQIGMPDPASLERTVSMYNACVDAKNDPEFGQLPHNLVWKCEKPPFWATTASPALHYMCGGLRTNGVTTQVVDRWNRVIPGFYAAGEITGGVHGTNRLGGNATTDCIVFGRLAGREAAS